MRALAVVLAVAGALAAPAAPRVDWTRTVATTPEGWFSQGNPKAKVVLVEYLSLACPHCAAFEAEGIAPLIERYVKPGLVRYEVRTAFTSPFDLPATLLARCAGPAGFFRTAPAVYAAQANWEQKGFDWAQSTKPDLDKMKPADAVGAIAKGAGLDALFREHGLDDKRQTACLADEAGAKKLAAASDAIWAKPGFPGTPAFEVDGALAGDIHTWPQLQARLDAALK